MATYLTLTAVVVAVLAVPLGVLAAGRERDQLFTALERDARVIAAAVEDRLERGVGLDPQAVATDYAARVGGRAVVVGTDGVAVADSAEPGSGEDYSNRPEVTTALAGDVARGTRHSDTAGGDLLYVAVPSMSGDRVYGAVRITYPSSELDGRVRRIWFGIGALGLAALAAAAGVGILLARSMARPVTALRDATHRLAAGDLGARTSYAHGPAELRQLAQDFGVMASRLHALVDGQRAFVADASHQLRTPLTALSLRLAALEERVGPSDPDLQAAQSEAARLGHLVDGLLALARVEGGRPAVADVDAVAVVRERIELWEPLAAEDGVTLTWQGPARALVQVVPGALEQVLDNLLANALDAVGSGGHVAVAVTADGSEVAVSVDDDGPGLGPEGRERAFDRFWRGADADPGGTGLGLAIVRGLAEASSGTARLEESPMGGLRAEVRLRPARQGG